MEKHSIRSGGSGNRYGTGSRVFLQSSRASFDEDDPVRMAGEGSSEKISIGGSSVSHDLAGSMHSLNNGELNKQAGKEGESYGHRSFGVGKPFKYSARTSQYAQKKNDYGL